MTEPPNDPQLRVIGLAWFRKEDYPALRRIFEDGHKMPTTWKEWLEGAEEMEERAKAQGVIVERVYFDPDTFPAWCAAQGVPVDRQGRHAFIGLTLAGKHRNQS